MTNLQRIQQLNEKAKKLPNDRAKKAVLIGLEIGRKMQRHINAKAKKNSS